MRNSGIDIIVQNKLIRIIKAFFPTAHIFLYGSRARGDFTTSSDIDIALDAGSKIAFDDLGELRAVLDAASIPYKIDIADIHSVQVNLKDAIEKEKIIWSD